MNRRATHLVIDDKNFLVPVDLEKGRATLGQELDGFLAQLQAWREQGDRSFFGLPFIHTELDKVHYWSKRIRERARRLIVLGIGGSALGGRMLVSALAEDGLPVEFYDNVDPQSLEPLNLVDWRESFLLVISKSGDTMEPLAQLLSILPDLEAQLGSELCERVAVITGEPESALGQIANSLELPIIAHPAVGGRFSVLTVVGLLPAAVAGVAVDTLLQGAQQMAERCLSPSLADNPALLMGCAQHLMAQAGRSINVQMTYADRLRLTSDWYAQLCGESLGKRTLDDRALGLTPLSSHGATDQHSLLQLFLDGPEDKQFSFLFDPLLGKQGRTIGARFQELKNVPLLVGKSLGALFEAEYIGTYGSLISKNAPVRCFHLPSRDAHAMGELILLLETEIVLLAHLLDINPFDQPAVEHSKQLTRDHLAMNLHSVDKP